MCIVYMVECSKRFQEKLGFSYELTSKRLPGLQIRKRSSEKKELLLLNISVSQRQAWACRNSQPTTHSECRAFRA